MKWRLASILLLGLVFMFAACMIKINYEYAEPQNQYQYYAGSVLLFMSSLVAAAGAGEILYKVVPPHFGLKYWNAGMICGTAELFGKVGQPGLLLFTPPSTATTKLGPCPSWPTL